MLKKCAVVAMVKLNMNAKRMVNINVEYVKNNQDCDLQTETQART